MQPTYNATGFNSLPTVDFAAASNNVLLSANSALAMGNATSSFFLVGQMRTGTNTYGRAISFEGSNNGNDTVAGSVCGILRNSSNNEYGSYTAGLRCAQAISLATNYRLGVIYDGSDVTPYLNNVAGTPGGAYSTALDASGRLALGRTFSASECWDGPISEVIIANSALSAGDRNSLDTYFKAKWGL